MKKILVHNGGFHADDIFAVATLILAYPNEELKIVRSRDEKEIESADIVVDVGGKYDGQKFFDHHQTGGAGARPNTIPYASFGLIWKHFSNLVCSTEVAALIDQKVVQIVDGIDNGVSLFSANFKDIPKYDIDSSFASFNSTTLEPDRNQDTAFLEAVGFAKIIIQREIKMAEEYLEARKALLEGYAKADDKRIIVVDRDVHRNAFVNLPEDALFVVRPRSNGEWGVEAIRKTVDSFESRKNFPESWGGKRDAEFQAVSGVPDATFCHKGLFLAGAKTKGGAIALAKKTIQ